MNFAKALVIAALLLSSGPSLAETCGLSLFKFPQLVCGRELRWEHAYIIMHTRPGERVMRPEFGTNWDALCFAPATEEQLRAMEAHLKEQFRINAGLDVVSVKVAPAGGEPPQYEITIVYKPNEPGTPLGTTDTLVVPFNCGE
jgi:hypothetical protein